jgi:hypothetical protein
MGNPESRHGDASFTQHGDSESIIVGCKFSQEVARFKACDHLSLSFHQQPGDSIEMHQTQKSRHVMEAHGQDFITSTIPRLQEAGRDQRFIINMDQTPVFFSMTPKTTLQV